MLDERSPIFLVRGIQVCHAELLFEYKNTVGETLYAVGPRCLRLHLCSEQLFG